MYQQFVFDLDGTLIDTAADVLGTLVGVITDAGLDASALNTTFIGPPLEAILRKVLPEIPETEIQRLAQTHRTRYLASQYPGSIPYAGITSLLRHLRKQGKSVFVSTNKPVAATRRLLNAKGLTSYFTDIACTDSAGAVLMSKAGMLGYLMERNGFREQDTLMIGDTVLDVQGGKEAGTATLAALYGYGEHSALLAAKPDFVVETAALTPVRTWPKREPVDIFGGFQG